MRIMNPSAGGIQLGNFSGSSHDSNIALFRTGINMDSTDDITIGAQGKLTLYGYSTVRIDSSLDDIYISANGDVYLEADGHIYANGRQLD